MCHPHQPQASGVSKRLPGCSCQDFSYQTRALFLCLAELKPELSWMIVYVCGNRQEAVTSSLKAAGWWGGRESQRSCQNALKQEFELLPPHSFSVMSFLRICLLVLENQPKKIYHLKSCSTGDIRLSRRASSRQQEWFLCWLQPRFYSPQPGCAFVLNSQNPTATLC